MAQNRYVLTIIVTVVVELCERLCRPMQARWPPPGPPVSLMRRSRGGAASCLTSRRPLMHVRGWTWAHRLGLPGEGPYFCSRLRRTIRTWRTCSASIQTSSLRR
jgi:hypothetical protein